MSNESNKPGWKTAQLRIDGMHCGNCEVLIERRFKKVHGVRKVTARQSAGTAEVVYYGDLDIHALEAAVKEDGYTVSLQPQDQAPVGRNSTRHYLEIVTAFMIVVTIFLLLKSMNLLPDNLAIPDTISFGFAFAIGAVASISTCIAVTGGLLVAVAAKYNSSNGKLTGVQRFKPHLYFNAGRIISYTLLGGAIGALGSTFTLSLETNALLILAASFVMIMLGMQMLSLLPKRASFIRMPKFLAHKIHDLSERNTKGGAFILGGLTFFLPCGFTQALQLYVLAKGSFATGALVMLAFSLGTLPALLSLSALSSFVTGAFQKHFLKLAGATVVLLGLFSIQNGLTLGALATNSSASATSSAPTAYQSASPAFQQAAVKTAPIVDGKQVIEMKIAGLNYVPNQFSVVQGIPVEWRIDASQAIGCGRILMAPAAGIRKALPSGTTTLTFTPEHPGEIRFNCSMGMMTRGSKITVLAASNKGSSADASPPAATPAVPLADRRVEIEKILRDYLLKNPEVLQEAYAELQKRQQVTEIEARQSSVANNAAVLFNSPRQVVLGNPQGDVTMVEFFDYNCGYCKRALSDMQELLTSDPKLKIVLKEFPVLGQGSVEAAQVAVAVRMQDEGGKKYFEFHRKLLGLRGQADHAQALAAAKDAGVDMERLKKDISGEEVKSTLSENMQLADALGLSGTPSYVIGSEVVVGAVGVAALREKIAAVRK